MASQNVYGALMFGWILFISDFTGLSGKLHSSLKDRNFTNTGLDVKHKKCSNDGESVISSAYVLWNEEIPNFRHMEINVIAISHLFLSSLQKILEFSHHNDSVFWKWSGQGHSSSGPAHPVYFY